MAASDYVSAVQQLYVAYFGRPADTSGLTNFTTTLNAQAVTPTIQGILAAYSTNDVVRALVDGFGTSTESSALYGSGTTESFVFSVYQNVLGRTPLAAGFNFWVDAINNGGASLGSAALRIMEGALSNTTTQGLADAALINAKISVATNFTTAITTENATYSGATAAAAARTMLSTVTATTDVTAFQSTIVSTLSTITNPDVGTTFTLTTAANAPALTAKNDAVTATDLTFNANDVIVDSNSADSDSLTVNVTNGTGNLAAATATVIGVENINFNFTSFAAPIVDAVNIKSGNINFSQAQTGGATTAQVNNAGNVSVVAGTGVTGNVTVTQGSGVSTTVVSKAGVSVTAAAAAGTVANTINVTAGASKAITVGGTAALTDAATILGSGTSNLTTNSGAAVETLTVKGNGAAATFVLQNALTGATLTAAGEQNVTVSASSAQVTGIALTDSTTDKTTTLKVTGTTDGNDLSKVGFDGIEVTTVSVANDDLIFASTGDVVTVSATANRLDLVAEKAASTGTTDSITIIGTGATTVIGNATGGAGATADGFETVNYSSGATAANSLTATLGANATLNVTGTKNVTIAATSTAKEINAANLSGVLTVTTAAGLTKVTSGSGADVIGVAVASTVVANAGDDAITSTVGGALGTIDAGAGDDTVTLVAGDTGTVAGGEGTDTLNLAGASAAAFSGFEVISAASATGVKVSSLSGSALILKGDTIAFAASDIASVDLSTITVDPAMTSITFGNGLDSTKFGSATGFTFTGSSVKDIVTGTVNADTINGGAGADEISAAAGNDTIVGGEGADAITGSTGADTINLVEVTAATDTVNIAAADSVLGTVAAPGYDSITGFAAVATNGDVLKIANATVAASLVAADVTGATTETEAGTLTASTNATGILSLTGAATDKANVNTLAEWVAVAEAVSGAVNVATGATVYHTMAFEFGGNTYVVQTKTVDAADTETFTTEAVVELVGLVGVTGLNGTAAANVIDFA